MTTSNTNTQTPNPSNPSSLPSRYEIRKLEPHHAPWAGAILVHSNLFHSPVWPHLYPENLTARLHRSFPAGEYLVTHQIQSGMSFGVFDTQYVYKRPESAATGGALYWDASEPSVQESGGLEAESRRLLLQMDFPLVSIALSYDAFDPLDFNKMGALVECLPHFGIIYHVLAQGDRRDPDPSVPSRRGEVLNRNGTATRQDYAGEGIMAALARWLMKEAAGRGYRGIQIETSSDAVKSVWEKAEEPFKGSVVSRFVTSEYVDEEGKRPFGAVRQECAKIWVDLKSEDEN
ncbi:uncharacterized protein EI97DRAFT_377962 [Westerdykella ornata]|uniref:N-acetyltransferase domain-containing protein n=1 Tax=Westerdykella ornata TaxID=318751 RepID=A0A6A6JMX5_WESOR|nr:uncharacterized protein EI97DRAFT_377962 [Westerdykella ornata]KAF2276289.1 hypothetical protein EI97DRAFT_377962 [Westerdykella ornata]